MDWSRAKTWLIILFACVNLFLVYMLVQSHFETSVLSDQTIENTVKILNRSNISVEKNVIPKGMPNLGNVEVANAIGDIDSFVTSMIGEGYILEAENQYKNGDKTLVLSGDEISYKDLNPQDKIDGLSKENASRYAINLLAKMGFDMSKASGVVVEEKNDMGTVIYSLKLTQKLDIYTLFDSTFNVNICSYGILSLNGSWFSISDKGSGFSSSVSRVKSACSVLLDFSAYAAESGKAYTVKEVSLGYTTGEKGEYHKAVGAAPVWRIVTDSETYYRDAI